jgi:hypothetical protein
MIGPRGILESMPELSGKTQVLIAVLGLAPALIGTGLKWLQDNSKSKRRSELCERLGTLSKTYSDQNPGVDEVLDSAHRTLANEIHAVCLELGSLQAESKRSSRRTLYGWLSDLFLLYRPRGLTAWTVHIVFYAGMILLLFALLGSAISPWTADSKYGLAGVFIFGLLLFALQRLASRLHGRAQDHQLLLAQKPGARSL